jgi:hypothetical protein
VDQVDHDRVRGLKAKRLPRGEYGRGRGSVVFPASSEAVDVACYAARWLAQYAELIREHPAALEAYRGLTAAIDRPLALLFIGACDLCGAASPSPGPKQPTRSSNTPHPKSINKLHSRDTSVP